MEGDWFVIKKIIKKILYRERATSESYITYLRNKGIKIGENCIIHNPRTTTIDITQPSLISIGNGVSIVGNTTILCHDMSWRVFKNLTGEIIGANGEVIIGNNVFIGLGCIILQNTRIGNNVIIGAGSLVTKDIPDNVVVGGRPAKILMTLDEYYNKRKKEYVEDAKKLANSYKERYGTVPPKEIFRDYFPLFTRAEELEEMNDDYKKVLNLGGEVEQCIKVWKRTEPLWKNYETFMGDIFQESKK